MKKTIYFLIIGIIAFVMCFSASSYAASLDTITITTSSDTIHPGEEVTLAIDFGTPLGSYTFDIAYDNNLFSYVSTEGGTANDTGTKVRAYYFDSQGGTNPRTSMSMVFRAKEGITTSNPTDFSITAEGLANADASVQYDDITTPIVKNVVVEPQYENYTVRLSYTGDVIEKEAKDMTITIASPMGRYYDHARLVAEATTPSGATAQLLATDEQQLEHDIIDSGWGDASGYKIGGKDVNQVLQARGVFSDVGTYTITLSLIDRDNGDVAIASTTSLITVSETGSVRPPEETPSEPSQPEETPSEPSKPETDAPTAQTPEPTTLPKTGTTLYTFALPAIFALGSIAFVLRRKV